MKKTLLAIMVLLLPVSFAHAQDQCVEKDLSGVLKITGKNLEYFEEHNMSFIAMQGFDGKRISFQVSYGDKDNYIPLQGQTATVSYKKIQYFNEMDGECVQEDKVLSITK